MLDAGGHLIALERHDGASTLRPQPALGKAAGALGLGVSSRAIAAMAAERPSFVASLGPIAPHGMVPAAGGVIISAGGVAIGTVGITGDTSDNDESCALAGIAAAGLTTQSCPVGDDMRWPPALQRTDHPRVDSVVSRRTNRRPRAVPC